MTDTRKEYEEWMNNCPLILFGGEFQVSELAWQACQSLNDKRIQQLLAVIAKKDEALKLSAAVFSGEISDKSGMIKSLELLRESIAINPEDVELEEFGEADFDKPAGTVNLYIYNIDFDGMHKLYTIKTKGGNDANFG